MNLHHHLLLGASLLVALVGCSSSATGSGNDNEVPLIAGFDPPAPTSNQTRVYAPIVANVPAGGDVSWCTYIANPFGQEVDVVQSRGYQSKFGHHAILMEVIGAESKLGQSALCTDDDMTNARFLAGGSDGAAQFEIPEGVGFRIKKASVLMIQTHWINTSAAAVQGQAVFNITTATPDANRQPAQLFAEYTAAVKLPPRAAATATTDCVIQQDLNFFALGGHAHEWGTHVSLSVDRNAATEVLYDHKWQPEFQSNPPLTYYDTKTPLVLHKGDVLHVTCDYQNVTDNEIRFPREMCVGMGFYFPGDADVQCGDGFWAQGNAGMP